MRSYLVLTTATFLLSACSSGGGDNAGSEGDLVPPLAGTVADGLSANVNLQTSMTTISANWTGFTDNEGPIAYYEWCIGTTVGGTELQPWTSTDANTSATNSSLTLQASVRYYVSVRAYDSASNVSAISTSDGVEVSPGGGGPPTGGPNEASLISQWGITWTFDHDYPVGQFCNGDWWVVGPVTIVSISPPCQVSAGRTINGSMINPVPRVNNGYDSGIPSYSDSLNVARNLSGSNRLTVPNASSLISVISAVPPVNYAHVQTAAVLTVVAAEPPADAFRPAYAGTDKVIRYRESDLNYGVLAQLTPAAGAPSMAATAALFQRVWLDHCPGWQADYFHPLDNMNNYGREIGTATGDGALMLNCNFSNAAKRDTLVRMVQIGLDNFGNLSNGCTWEGDGGEASGRKFPILLAGRTLTAANMLAIGQNYQSAYVGNPTNSTGYFGEDSQTFYVQETSTGVFNWGLGNYARSHLGLPDWGIRHSRTPQQDNSDWNAVPYRRCCTANAWVGYCLAARVMGLQQAWNHPAFFDYMDRYIGIEGLSTWTGCWGIWQGTMWQAYRAQF